MGASVGTESVAATGWLCRRVCVAHRSTFKAFVAFQAKSANKFFFVSKKIQMSGRKYVKPPPTANSSLLQPCALK